MTLNEASEKFFTSVLISVGNTKLTGFWIIQVKRIYAPLLAILMMLSLTACNSASEDSGSVFAPPLIPTDESLTKLRDVNHNEMASNFLPDLKESALDISKYDTVFVGYPVWATDVPQAVISFLNKYDFSDKTVIPFCTHDGYGAVPEREKSIRLIRLAHELGCNFFDTAEGYGAGHNETIVGEALKPIRNEVVLATKLHIPELNGKSVSETVKEHLRASMKRLQTDHIDLYYWHRVNPAVSLEAVAEAMGELIKEGYIGGWGLSQITEEQLLLAHSVTPLTAVQSEYSMMERMFEKDVIPACGELGVGFVPFSPLGAGFLSGKYSANEHYSGDDVRRVITRFAPENVSANQPLLELLQKFANEKNATSAQIALAWMLHKYDHIVPIPGMRREERVRENLGSADVDLAAEELAELEKALSEIEIYGNRTDEDIAKLRYMD